MSDAQKVRMAMLHTIRLTRSNHKTDADFLRDYVAPMAQRFGEILALHVEHGTTDFKLPDDWDAERWAAMFLANLEEVELPTDEPEETNDDDGD